MLYVGAAAVQLSRFKFQLKLIEINICWLISYFMICRTVLHRALTAAIFVSSLSASGIIRHIF